MTKKFTLAIDPGGTSGMATNILGSYKTFVCITPEEVFSYLIRNKDLFSTVVIETFQAQLIGKWGLHTVRIVGGVYALCFEHKIEYVPHMPGERKAFLKEAKDYLRQNDRNALRHDHEMDALAHLMRHEYDMKEGH